MVARPAFTWAQPRPQTRPQRRPAEPLSEPSPRSGALFGLRPLSAAGRWGGAVGGAGRTDTGGSGSGVAETPACPACPARAGLVPTATPRGGQGRGGCQRRGGGVGADGGWPRRPAAPRLRCAARSEAGVARPRLPRLPRLPPPHVGLWVPTGPINISRYASPSLPPLPPRWPRSTLPPPARHAPAAGASHP